MLDRDLPRVHGDDVCRALTAEQPETKVLMLTAARSTGDLVGGLALGADDYLPKPFRFAELVARLRALGAPRRRGAAAGAAARATSSSTPRAAPRPAAAATLDLTPKEFAVLEVLLSAAGRRRLPRGPRRARAGTKGSTRSRTPCG